MDRRIFPFLVPPLLGLAVACNKQGNDNPMVDAAAHAASVPCAIDGSPIFRSNCMVERKLTGDGLVLIMHHPDGGFRRLLVTTDGRGVVTADGAENATVSVVDPGTIEVSVGQDRYRLPATVKGGPIPQR